MSKSLSFYRTGDKLIEAYQAYAEVQSAENTLNLVQATGQILGSVAAGYIAGKIPSLRYTSSDRLGDAVSGRVETGPEGTKQSKSSTAYKKGLDRIVFDAVAAEATSTAIDNINDSGIVLEYYDLAREWATDQFENIDNFINDVVDNIEGGINRLLQFLDETFDGFRKWIMDILTELWQEAEQVANNIFDTVNNFFQDALDWIPRGDPLTLDLDGDGIETIASDGTVLFDHDGDGTKTSTGWIQSDDGIVVMDRNNNGRELFGDNTIKADGSIAVDGFDTLSDLDSNGDGLVDASDTSFSRLLIWRDFNADGISQSNELFTLSQLDIESIGTAGVAANTNVGNDNIAIAEGTFTYSNGQTGTTGVCGFREAA